MSFFSFMVAGLLAVVAMWTNLDFLKKIPRCLPPYEVEWIT